MPRAVDHEGRRRAIIEATVEIIGEVGLDGLSFRAVAARLGGSSTLVTHYYSSRQALLDDLGVRLLRKWEDEVARLEAGVPNPRERLRLVLEWLLPSTKHALIEERARINLLASRNGQFQTLHLFRAWDRHMRSLIGRHLVGLVPDDRIDTVVDLLRSLTSGIALSAVEHPSMWTAKRQRALVEAALAYIGLDQT
jgi:AcrR family transcriptional regulator